MASCQRVRRWRRCSSLSQMPWFPTENSAAIEDDDSICVLSTMDLPLFFSLALFCYLYLNSCDYPLFIFSNRLHPLSWVSYMAPRADNFQCGVVVGGFNNIICGTSPVGDPTLMAAERTKPSKKRLAKIAAKWQWTPRALTPTMASAASFVFFCDWALHIWSVREWNISVSLVSFCQIAWPSVGQISPCSVNLIYLV